MGCDIHLYQEKKVNGKWVTADHWEPDKYEPGTLHVPYGKRLFAWRNYDLFAVLADVRNGVGFAGIVTGSRIEPIAPPRGVPADACAEYKQEVERWGEDGHSHSWVTLADLENYAWPAHHNRAVVQLDVWRKWKASGANEPESYAGSVSGPGIKIISEVTARNYVLPDPKERVWVEARWDSSLRDDCHAFLAVVLPRLRQLETECGAGNARLVFFFDN